MTTTALPTFSLKRIRSNNTAKASSPGEHLLTSSSNAAATSKFSKFRSGLSVITKFTRPFASHHASPPTPPPSPLQPHASRRKWRHRWSQHFDRHRRLSSILSYSRFDSGSQHDRNPFANDTFYEHARYKQASRSHTKLGLKGPLGAAPSNDYTRQNAQTVPATPPPPMVGEDGEDASAIMWRRRLSKAAPIAPPPGILVKHIGEDVSSSSGAVVAPTAATRVRSKSSSSINSSRCGGNSHIRHTSSSNMTVNSEDLTAKEFADIAGIRILGDSNLSCYGNDAVLHTVSTSTRSSLQGGSHHRSMRSAASSSMLQPHIWDAEFWQDPDAPQAPVPEQPTAPIQQEWRRRRSRSNEPYSPPSRTNSNCVIKRGRFEICLETAERAEALAATASCVPKIVTTDVDQ